MPLDPQMQTILDLVAGLNLPPYAQLAPEEARRQFDASRPPIEKAPVAKVEDRTVPGPAGDIPVRIYTPAGDGPFPVLVYFHGGGWVIGNIESYDYAVRPLTNAAGCVVVSVEYRLAPEHKFPAAAEDCYATARWVAAHAAAIGGRPGPIAVGGDSAGGNLAAVVALMARDRGGPAIGFQLLVYPVTDHSFATPSYRDNAEGYLLTRDAMVWFWDHYLRTPADGADPLASPLRAPDLRGLPPALVQTAEFDPLRDEGEAYAARLKAAGVPVTVTRYAGVTHGFFNMSHALDKAKAAVGEAGQAVRTALAAP